MSDKFQKADLDMADNLEGFIEALQSQQAHGREFATRERALAITKLQEAQFWLRKSAEG